MHKQASFISGWIKDNNEIAKKCTVGKSNILHCQIRGFSLHFMLILYFQQLKGGLSQGQSYLKDRSLEFHKLLRIIQGAFHNTTL